MAQSFIEFFHDKVQKICDGLSPDESPSEPLTSSSLSSFRPTTPDEIQSLLQKLPPKFCRLDPIPTILLKDCSLIFAPIISQIVNLSIEQACVPSLLKCAHITPLLKKPSLDPDSLLNYRPVSNLPFLFKILERIVFSRLSDYLLAKDLFDPFQSAYRPHHSVETLLVNVSNYILQEIDHGNITALLLLDLSSAFDTVNHTILLNTLRFDGLAYEWFFQSYLSHHSQTVCIKGTESHSMPLSCGVPQGSVGGPTLFSIYLIGLRQILLRHGIRYHIYADDIQLMVSFKSNQIDAQSAVHRLEACMNDIQAWIHSHSLKQNFAKCEFLVFGSKAQLSKIDVQSISFSGHTINLSQTCRNLGVIFEYNLTMSSQIYNICKSVRYQLRNIGFIRKYLSRSATEKIVLALISSRLDFGNALLHNLPQSQLSKLQKLQYAAARIVTLSPKRTHITPILQSLHWLPIKDRIVFKILLLIFHCVQGSAPQYNISLVHPYIPARNLRSSTSRALIIPKSTKTWGQRAFAHAEPYLWNSLPEDIKNCKSSESFKNHLKTYLFIHC